MFTYRSFVALTLLAAAACSGNDATSPGLDPSTQIPVASRIPATGASSITIAPATATVAVGSTITLTGAIKSATGVDLTATLGSQATLLSSDTTIATVSKLGVVTGLRNGVATITAALGTLSSKSTITVGSGVSSSSSTPSSITVTPAAATVAVGSTIALGGSVKSATGVDLTTTVAAQITLASSDATIATVSATGVVTGLRNGVATITAKIGTLSSSSTITVGTGVVSTGPAPTPAPPTGGSPVSSLSFLSDNYTEYANTAAFQARVSSNIGGTASPGTALYTDGANASLAAIDNTVLYNGHQTLKYNQPGGVANSPELWVGFSQTLTHLWFRAKIRFSSGFTTAGTLTNSANAYKLLGWGWNNYYGSGRLEISNTNQYQLYWTALAESNSATVGGGTTGIAGNITTEWTDGGWYDYIIEVDYSQGPTGTARVWMAKDGQTPVLQTTSSGTMQGGAPLPTLNQIMLGMNFNQTRAAGQTQALWYGQWEVIDGSQHANPYNL
ncbi:MAG TPA: Ig-like domain-containing protein [Gemmatimonadaceae bacterium]|jgi:uncharacterized protein YjdB|nr:Ig-like domain-containing protein [Gemmatimonadaceae bacterium]